MKDGTLSNCYPIKDKETGIKSKQEEQAGRHCIWHGSTRIILSHLVHTTQSPA
jgi:hypothetical protein